MKRRLHRRERKKQRRQIIIISLALLLFISVGYAAYNTNISLKAKGNIKDLKKEVDSKVPTNELLFWGQADNKDNTSTILKDKSGNNNDGTISGATFKDNTLEFDGVDDYVDLGFANYDFKNSISYVIYVKATTNSEHISSLFGNWQSAGGGIEIGTDGSRWFDLYNGSTYIIASTSIKNDETKFYTIIGTYDGSTIKLYINGQLISSNALTNMTTSIALISIGSNPGINNYHEYFAKMSFKEAMLYDRALSDYEINTITQGFERKYKE